MAAGAVWIFTRNNSVWSQQGDKLVGSGAAGLASQGVSVSLSAGGDTAIVGGPADNSPREPQYVGAAWVFVHRTKEDCKNGGWLNFAYPPGPFTNQGQCVNYFAKQK